MADRSTGLAARNRWFPNFDSHFRQHFGTYPGPACAAERRFWLEVFPFSLPWRSTKNLDPGGSCSRGKHSRKASLLCQAPSCCPRCAMSGSSLQHYLPATPFFLLNADQSQRSSGQVRLCRMSWFTRRSALSI